MSQYIFQLGNTPELSIAEIKAVRPELDLSMPLEDLALAELASDETAQELMDVLGGTVKIIKVLAEIPEVSPEGLNERLAAILALDDKVQFSIAELGRDHLPPIEAADIKTLLTERGVKVRYREGSRHGLSAAVLLNTRKLKEFYVVQTANKTYLGQTVVVQNIDDWSKRDRQKPYADRKKGMLPPKVARIMVNLTVRNDDKTDKTLMDPFCGSGTVLMEAMLSGVNVIGNDQDPAAVEGSRKNIEWLEIQEDLEVSSQLFMRDATRLELPRLQRVDYIATEPFLGKPKPNISKLPFIFKGLERLYLGAFRQWTKLLRDGARVTIVFPYVEAEFRGETQVFSLEALIDKIQELGYTTNSKPINYHRSHAVVQRQIYQFVYRKEA